jgi:carbon storage regulator
MLVLSRKPLQSIMIGPDIRITIVKLDRNQVRIWIEAPRDVTILRQELIGAEETEPHLASHPPISRVQLVTT